MDPFAQGLNQPVEGSLQRIAPRDHHIVMSGPEWNPCQMSHRFTQSAAHAVSLDRIALFLGNGVTNPGRFVGEAAIQGFKQKERTAQPVAFLDGKEIRPVFEPPGFLGGGVVLRHAIVFLRGPVVSDQADRRLRPRARRAWMTLRPPLVAMRARKP